MVILLILVPAVLLAAWFSIRWQIGSMLAELTPASAENVREIADVAVSLAPRDPLALWLKAGALNLVLTDENIDASTRLYEEAVRRSPDDFRWRIELGRAYERAGRSDEAERSFSRAAALAPNYSYVRWQLGNFYVRQGKQKEAIEELTKAAKNNYLYREQTFSLAWQYFGRDVGVLETLAGDDPEAIARLSSFLAANDRPADAEREWGRIPEGDRERFSAIAKNISLVLRGKGDFRSLVNFARWSGTDPDANWGSVTNGGFEKPIRPPDESIFDWHLTGGEPQIVVNVDRQVKHSGNASLRFTYKGYSKPAYYGTGQIVAVEPGSRYALRYWTRTEDLKSGGPPNFEIVASDGSLLASSPAFPTGTTPWAESAVGFNVPAGIDGITIRISRSYCGENCPIVGTVWVDDVSLSSGSL